MSAVQRRNGQHVQEAQHDAQKGRELPETAPVPLVGVLLQNGVEPAHFLVRARLRRENHLELPDVVRQTFHRHVPALGHCGKSAKRFVPDGVVPRQVKHRPDAHLARVGQRHGEGHCLPVPDDVHLHRLALQGRQRRQILVVKRHGLAVQAHQAVALDQACLLGTRPRRKLVHHKRHPRHGQGFLRLKGLLDEGVGNGEVHPLALALHRDDAARSQQHFYLHRREILDRLSVDRQDLVSALQAQGLAGFQGPNAVAQVAGGHVLLAPVGHHAGINDNSQHKIHGDAAQQNDQALPRLFASKFPRFRGLFQGICVHAFVHHAGNFHVPAQRQPAQTHFGMANFLFEHRKPRIKEQIKLLDACFERNRGQKMPQFVQNNQDRKTENQLCQLNNHSA